VVIRLVELRMQHQRLHRCQGWHRLWVVVEDGAAAGCCSLAG
jgi:hypothetical protein